MGKVVTLVGVCLTAGATVLAQPAPAPAAGGSAQALDLVLVLDNSGSMKKNDPQFLTRAVVSEFVASNRLPADTQVGIVIFADGADLALPLSPLNDVATRQRIKASLERLDYRGRLTDTAAAVERAFYEVRHSNRPSAQKVIVLMTDGIIDTGNKARDAEKYRWLTTDLSDACVRAGARIFGVAFTDSADYQLIQSLGEKTGGDYYRIIKSDEVSGAFGRIADGLTRRAAPAAAASNAAQAPQAATRASVPAPVAPAAAPAPAAPASTAWLLVGPVVGLGGIVVAFVALTLFWRGGRPAPAAASSEESLIPEGERAYLRDLNEPPVLADPKYELTHCITRIGRMKERPGVMRVNRGTVSAQHAEIRYKNGTYYLVDTESINKTRVDEGSALQPYTEYPLKGGRTISIADCNFEFVVDGADTEKTQAWILDPTVGLKPPVAKKGQGGNYFAS